MTLKEFALKLRPFIEKAAKSLPDEDALEAVNLYPNWSGDSIQYTMGDRVRYEQILYKVLQTHTSQPNWNPLNSPSLFAKVLIPDPDIIPDWEQPDSTNGYSIGDKVKYNGHTYESTINNNVWAPDVYGWVLID